MLIPIHSEVGNWSPHRHMWRQKQNICNVNITKFNNFIVQRNEIIISVQEYSSHNVADTTGYASSTSRAEIIVRVY